MIGIRREDKNAWERRSPLTPDHVAELQHNHGLRFAVQPSARRVFHDTEYRQAGAALSEDLSTCRIILGVKEIPEDKLLPGKTYLYFSHMSKGQQANMPALRRLLELGCTLVDYELVFDSHNRRLIFFGRHAGYAGMIDCLWAFGRRLAAEGHITPFEEVRLAHDYSGLDEATHHLARIGERLRRRGLPDALRPIVCGFTGSGNVSQGAQEILERLPTLDILPEELPALARDPDRPRNLVYKVRFRRKDRIERTDGGPVDLDEFDAHPERYQSAMPRWLPHLTLLVNGAFWRPGQPRLVELDHLRALWAGETPKLRVIADIACDIGGSVEATVRATTPGEPVYVYDLKRDRTSNGVEGPGPVILAVDNLPCQLPGEASEHFGDGLARFIPAIARCDWSVEYESLNLPEEMKRAAIVHRGELTPAFAFLDRHLGAR